MNQAIKKVLNWAIKHLTKVTFKQNDNSQGFMGFPISTSSGQDILKMKSSHIFDLDHGRTWFSGTCGSGYPLHFLQCACSTSTHKKGDKVGGCDMPSTTI